MNPAQERASRLIRQGLDLQGRVERNPYGMMAGGLAVGYVLGGGLFTRLTERIVGAALRAGVMAVLPRLEEELGWSRDAQGGRPASEKGE
jgi:hypothetical protein